MNKKKVDSILKGVTAAGIAIGGVSTIQGADMVMAQEIENQVNDQTSQSAGSMSDSMSDTPSESRSESEANQASENQTETASEETSASQTESTSEQNANSTSVEETEATSETEPASQQTKSAPMRMMAFKSTANNVTAASLGNETQVVNNEKTTQEEDSQTELTSEQKSESIALSKEESTLLSESSSGSESVSGGDSEAISQSASNSVIDGSLSVSASLSMSESESEDAKLSLSLSQANSQYESLHDKFVKDGLENQYLEDLISKINAKQSEYSKVCTNYKGTNISKLGTDYWAVANELANLLVRYSFYQDEGVTEIVNSSWVSTNGDKAVGNYVRVEYKKAGQTYIEYFDYVLADANGKVVYEQDGKIGSSTTLGENYSVAVLRKQLGSFKSGNNKLTWKDDGENRTWYVNGNKVDSIEEIKQTVKDSDGNYVQVGTGKYKATWKTKNIFVTYKNSATFSPVFVRSTNTNITLAIK